MPSPEQTPFEPPHDPTAEVTSPAPAASLRNARLALFGLFVASIPSMFGLQWLSNSPRFLEASGFAGPEVEGWVGAIVFVDMMLLFGAWLISRIEAWGARANWLFEEY